MLAGIKACYDCIRAFSETDQHDDLKKIDAPALIIQRDDEQIVPIQLAAMVQAKLMPHAQLKVYAGAPHGLPSTLKDRLNSDLLEFARARVSAPRAPAR